MRKNDTTGRRGRRTLGVAAASVAVLAVAGVSATQSFAASGHHTAGARAATSSVASTKHAAKHGTTHSTVPKAPSSASTTKAVHNTSRHITVPATKKNATQPYDGPTVDGLQAFHKAAADVLPGATFSHVTGVFEMKGLSGENVGSRGGLHIKLAGGTKSSLVDVEYWNAAAGEKARHQDCDDVVNCDILTLPDGSPMRIYDVPVGHGRANISASRLVNGVSVVVFVGVPPHGGPTVVSRKQLVDLLSQPVWGHLDPTN
jgi:hypothetical protein